ncbi:MAG: AraC family transcriptional regulator [Saprospiraceae bacterium]|jgi:AraC-like DNA-binding protein/quercetin dioxygenase-like cupin family protein
MQELKPKFENIKPSFGSSFTYLKFTNENKTNQPYWHFHPEYEIVYISNGNGQRKISTHLSEYENGDLIFVGPNLPHAAFSKEIRNDFLEIVVQMKEGFLGSDFFEIPEMGEVKKLFQRANTGLVFGEETKLEVGKRLRNMDLCDNFSKMTELLLILQIMAYAKDCRPLNINSMALEVKQQDQERMHILNDFIERNYQRKISVEEAAALVNMTVPSFCRFFKNLAHRTFIEYVNEFRVTQASSMLSQKHLSIGAVSFESGFNNISHFNKQFKLITGQTPTAYRKNLVSFVIK